LLSLLTVDDAQEKAQYHSACITWWFDEVEKRT
jgi:hypothetical protein